MTKYIVELKNPDHWKWKTHKIGKNKMKIRGKLKKWLKKNCRNSRILRYESPPIVITSDEEEAVLLKLTWM